MKIVILDGYTENPGDLSWGSFESFGELTVYDRTPEEKILERLQGVEIAYTNKTPLTEKTIRALPELKYIGVLATGFNVVDIEAAKKAGIPVTNIPDYGTDAVAQFTIALLLELCHHIDAHSELVKSGEWSKSKDFCFWRYPLIELKDKTMGIIGFGRIGKRTAEIAAALGMNVIAYDRNPDTQGQGLAQYVSLEALYERADVISLHCPLSPETEGIINKNTIARMKDGVLLINDSRGPLIVEQDLREALDSGKVAGAAVDVASREPIDADNPLLGAKNIIITPHIAWASKESRSRLMNIAVGNLRAFLDGKPVNVVNP